MTFDKKTILITGASAGIGRALAEKLAQTECNLILTARRIELLEDLKNQSSKKARIEIIKCDVSRKEDVRSAYERTKNIFGIPDLVILNAGVGIPVTVENFSSHPAEEIIKTNFLGVVYWTEVLLPDFIQRAGGIIAAVSSLADNRAYGVSFYNPSKAALTLFLEGLRLDLKKYNIKVLTIKPGFIKTGMTASNNFKMPFLLQPEDAARIILKGIEKEKKIIQFPLPLVLLTRIIGLLPLTVYEFFAGKSAR
jgi:short-subunit dehydrogenase